MNTIPTPSPLERAQEGAVNLGNTILHIAKMEQVHTAQDAGGNALEAIANILLRPARQWEQGNGPSVKELHGLLFDVMCALDYMAAQPSPDVEARQYYLRLFLDWIETLQRETEAHTRHDPTRKNPWAELDK